MRNTLQAKELFPTYFTSGDAWRCGEDFYLIEHAAFLPQTGYIQSSWSVILLVLQGEITVSLNDVSFKLKAGMSATALDKQNLSVQETSPDADVVVYILSNHINEIIFSRKGFSLYSEIRRSPIVVHDEYGLQVLNHLREVLKDVMIHPHSENLVDVCASVMSLYFRLVSPERFWKKQSELPQDDRYNQIMLRFTAILEKFYQRERAVKFYADQLCVTPKYLSVCTKHVTGHTANWWINNYVLRDATQMLVYGNLPVKSVALRLGFEDQMLFGKYFRRQMNMSPTEYKKQELKHLQSAKKG